MLKTANSLFLSFDYFEALFHKTEENNILLMNDEGIILEINDAFTTCFGYGPSDIIGKYVGILFTEEDQRQGKPENEIRNALSKGQASDDNYLVSKDKTISWVSGNLYV